MVRWFIVGVWIGIFRRVPTLGMFHLVTDDQSPVTDD